MPLVEGGCWGKEEAKPQLMSKFLFDGIYLVPVFTKHNLAHKHHEMEGLYFKLFKNRHRF